MLKKFISLSILLISPFLLKAQNEIYVSKKEAEVQIITNEGEKLNGKTRYTFISDLQEEIVFYNSHNEMQVFRPFEIKGFVFEGKEFVSVEQKGLMMGLNRLFLHKNTEGKMKLYTLYFLSNPDITITQEYYVQKNEEKIYGIKSLKFLNFKKEMSTYLSDVPELSQRVADKTYTSSDIEKIVDEYNGYLEVRAEEARVVAGK